MPLSRALTVHSDPPPLFSRRRSIAFGVALFGSAAALQAQQGTLTGTVSDARSSEPIAGVSVFIPSTQAGTLTRSTGAYRVQLNPGTYEVRARFFGFAQVRDTVTITAGQTTTRDFRLEKAVLDLDAVVVTGTRRADRTVLDAPAPIDVFTAEDVRMTGRTETNQIIQMLAPSFNFPRASVADGTDHVRPSTLRGLNPDQVLVLVNGKRRHNSALVNVNGTVGRGSTGVDLNAISASAIDRIEVLRDGAAAQYGSDAIAGVINIILKQNSPAELAATVGQTKKGDGDVAQASGNYSLGLGENGFLNLTGEFRDRTGTNRSNADLRPQYLDGDPRNANPQLDLRNHRQGDADVQDMGGFFNAGKTLGGVQAYGFGGFTYRIGNATGFFRRARDDRNVRAIYPNGFLPIIASDVIDGSAAVGLKGAFMGVNWDLSTLYGRNTFEFNIQSTLNASLGAASPTEFYAGKLGFDQWTTNLDLVRAYNVGLASPLNVAAGAEFRRDGYSIEQGEPDSYRDGGVRILDGPNAGGLPALGAQVFPGFRPTDEVDESRSNIAGYVDLETNLTRSFLLGIAGRAEDYSDFGSTVTGKVSARFEPTQGFAYRATASSGFRAPSLGQSFFSSTATNFIVVGGVNTPFDIKTFPVASREAQVLGASPLEAEKSTNVSIGITSEPLRNMSISVDGYRIFVEDRIVFSGNFIGADIQALLESEGFRGVRGGRYFTNAIDTRTDGIDAVINYGFALPENATLRFTGAYNWNRSRVTHVDTTPTRLGNRQEELFDRVERARIELGQPRSTVHLTGNYQKDRFGWNVHAGRFGRVTVRGLATDGSADQTFRSKWITDVSMSYRAFRDLSITLGGDNIFDVYPDQNRPVLSNSGIFPYNGISPFGFNGAFYFIRFVWGG